MPALAAGHTQAALITGASSGIGEALARRFAAAGQHLILVARRRARLRSLADELHQKHGILALVQVADLSDPLAAMRLATRLRRRKWTVNVLVNNAGVLEHGRFIDIAPERQLAMIDLNIAGLTSMLSAFMPGMLAQAAKGISGRILNVASIAAFQPVPSLATYAASKAYVLSLSESLSAELHGSGVSVTALCPGITATHMLSTATSADATLKRIPGFLVGDVGQVADEAFDACMRGEVICVPGAINRAATIASRSTPRWLLRRVGGLLNSKAL